MSVRRPVEPGPASRPGDPVAGDLDAVDRELVALLQTDGRATFEALAGRLGLSRPATRDRLRRLTADGTLRVVGVVHPSVFGLTASAHLTIDVDGSVLPVADAVAALADVPFVSLVTGACPLVAEVRTTDLDALAGLTRQIGALPGVRGVDVAVYTDIVTDAYLPTRPSTGVAVDGTDLRLLALLQDDGRASFASLGLQVGLSTGATRTRVLRLLDSGTVHIGARIHPRSMGLVHVTGVGLRIRAATADRLADLRALPEMQYLAAAVGRHDVVGTMITDGPARALEVLEAIRALPGVHALTTWTHLSFVKESYTLDPDHSR